MSLQHLTGTAEEAAFTQFAASVELSSPEDIVFAGAEISFCLLELPVADVLKTIPASLHPSIPGMIGLLHYSVPAGPWEAFELVLVGVLTRSGIKSRLFVTAAFCDNDVARDHLARTWGFPLREAEIKLAVNYDRVRSAVTIDSRLMLDFEVEHPISLTGAGGSVRYPQPFNPARRDGETMLIQVDASYEFDRVARGRPRITFCDPALIGGLDTRDCFPVTGTLAKTKMTLHPMRFVASTTVTAENDGVTKIVQPEVPMTVSSTQ